MWSHTRPRCPTARPAARCTWPPSATTAASSWSAPHTAGTIGRVLAGDVTRGTLHGAECPVIVAPPGFADRDLPLQTIGVGFDGSPESRAAVELARDIAAAAGARLKVIRVLEPPPPGGPALGYDADWAQRARSDAKRSGRTRRRARRAGRSATGGVVTGDPATELAYAGNDLDLLVTGSRNYGPVRRLMLGSTSTKLVHGAPCPVLVLTRGAEADTEHADAAAVAAHTS